MIAPVIRIFLCVICWSARNVNMNQIGACINHHLFSGAVPSLTIGLLPGVVEVRWAWLRGRWTVGRFLLGTNFNIENVVDNYRWSAVRLEQCKELVFTVNFNDTRRLPAQGCFLDRFVGVREGLWLIAILLHRKTRWWAAFYYERTIPSKLILTLWPL